MTISDAGFIASGVIFASAIIDAVRGRTGLGKHRLNRHDSSDRFWMAVALYFNLAFFLFWASGKAYQSKVEQSYDHLEEGGSIVIGEQA